MADTGNKLVRYLNPNGTLESIPSAFTITDPQGITLDAFENIYISQDNPANILISTVYGASSNYTSGSTSCSYGATCALNGAPFYTPGAFATDPDGNVFLSTEGSAYELVPTSDLLEKNYILLGDDFNYNQDAYNAPGPIAVDGSDNIYAYENGYPNSCFLSSNASYYAESDNDSHVSYVAGGRGCGFSGDGGQARSALIGTSVGQMTFDVAGNFYTPIPATSGCGGSTRRRASLPRSRAMEPRLTPATEVRRRRLRWTIRPAWRWTRRDRYM